MLTCKTVYVVRHGDLDNPSKIVYNWDGIGGITLPLSEKGKQQMKKMGDLLKQKGASFSKIYSSDFLRTRESAQILAKVLKINLIIFVKDLRESFAPALVGKSQKFLKEKYGGNVYTDYFIKKFHHETIEQVARRYYQTFLKIIRENPQDADLIMVGHGDPIRFLIAKLKNPQKKLTVEDYHNLSQTDYLKKGQAWEIKLDQNNNLAKAQILGEQFPNSGRDY